MLRSGRPTKTKQVLRSGMLPLLSVCNTSTAQQLSQGSSPKKGDKKLQPWSQGPQSASTTTPTPATSTAEHVLVSSRNARFSPARASFFRVSSSPKAATAALSICQTGIAKELSQGSSPRKGDKKLQPWSQGPQITFTMLVVEGGRTSKFGMMPIIFFLRIR